ncbi:MAG: hypothetical protein NPIRA04_17980 [Nitrospirales bacterium]|nr:MAG: hypothetical protein NPIRA04_17980 [Nitrospirales bacterium]
MQRKKRTRQWTENDGVSESKGLKVGMLGHDTCKTSRLSHTFDSSLNKPTELWMSGVQVQLRQFNEPRANTSFMQAENYTRLD